MKKPQVKMIDGIIDMSHEQMDHHIGLQKEV